MTTNREKAAEIIEGYYPVCLNCRGTVPEVGERMGVSMSNYEEHFQAFLTYAFIPLLFIGMIGIIVITFILGWDMLKDRFPRFPKYTAKVNTATPRTYIRVVHIDNIEASQEQGWELVDPHPTNPDYVVMTKPVKD